MYSAIHALVLGIIQGLTEFLPVSSSAHLNLLPWLLRWREPSLAFEVALHLGTLVALLIYYRQEWLRIIEAVFTGDRDGRRLLLLLAVASVPGAILGFLFEKQAETAFRPPLLTATTLAILGVALWVSDRAAPQERGIRQITIADAVLIGLAQAFALVPGVSRSGATITVGRLLKLNRQDAANFSFLMSAPIIAGAGLVKAPELIRSGLTPALLAGFAASAVFGLLAIALLLNYVRTRTYEVFAWYRLALAAGVIVIFLDRAAIL